MKVVLCANTDWFLYQYNRELCSAITERGDDLTLVSPPGRYSRELQAAGYHHVPWEVSRASVAPWTELASVRSLGRIFRELQPALIHNFTLKSVLYGSLAARHCPDAAVVNSITGLGWTFSSDKLSARTLRPIIRGLARVALTGTQTIFLNRADQQDFVNRGVLPEEATSLILSSGVDATRYVPSAAASDPPIATFVGRMLWKKGAAIFVDAARLLTEAGVSARFQLVGSPDPGNPDSIPEATLRSWNDTGVVEWIPFRDDVRTVYRDASIVCLPSAYGEGVPTVLLEAGAAARPLVAADNQGSREIVVHGETGLLVEPNNPEQLARALRQLLEDEALRAELGANARQLVMRSFCVGEVVERTLRVYSYALDRRSQESVPGFARGAGKANRAAPALSIVRAGKESAQSAVTVDGETTLTGTDAWR